MAESLTDHPRDDLLTAFRLGRLNEFLATHVFGCAILILLLFISIISAIFFLGNSNTTSPETESPPHLNPKEVSQKVRASRNR